MNTLWILVVGLICSAIFLGGMYLQFKIFRKIEIAVTLNWSELKILAMFSFILALPSGCAHEYLSSKLFKSFGESFVGIALFLYAGRFMFCVWDDGYYTKLLSVHIEKSNKVLRTLFIIPTLVSLSIFVVVFLGLTASHILGSLDERILEPLFDYKEILISTLVLCIIFIIKSIFGMTVATVTLTWFSWNYFIHDDYSLSPIFTVIIDLVMNSMPTWAIWLYTFFTLLYSLVSSIWLSVYEK